MIDPPLVVTGIPRITGEIGARSDLNASPETRCLPISNPFRTSPQLPYIYPFPVTPASLSLFFSVDNPTGKSICARDSNEIEIRPRDAGAQEVASGSEKRPVISRSSRIDFFNGVKEWGKRVQHFNKNHPPRFCRRRR